MTTKYSDRTPAVGDRVLMTDGEEFGKVTEVSGSCFKVDAPMQSDYWLSADCIASAEPGQVNLRFTKESLGQARDEGREHAGYHQHILDGAAHSG